MALRPHLIWGPGDNHWCRASWPAAGPAGCAASAGRTKLIDSVYIDNAADAHLLAADRLAPGSPIAGKAYFITQGEPLPLWDLVNGILRAAGLPPVTRTVPVWLGLRGRLDVGDGVPAVARRHGEPPLTRFLARELSTAHWFNIAAARRDLGYEPTVSLRRG